jgi:hypothetical protein
VKYYNIRQRNTYTQMIMHTYVVIRKSSELGTLLATSEKYQRKYLLKHDSLNLQNYRNSLPPIRRLYDTLVTMTSDNPVQATFLKQHMKPQINLFIVQMDREVDTAEDDPDSLPAPDDSIDVTLLNLRSSLVELIEREDQLLLQRTSQLRNISALDDTVHYASFVLIGVISALALKALLDKEKKNKELLASVQEANENQEAKTMTK